jgi:hypothetical protein
VVLTWNIEKACLEDFGEFYYTHRYYKECFVAEELEWKNVGRYVVILVRYAVGTCKWIKCKLVGWLVRWMDG